MTTNLKNRIVSGILLLLAVSCAKGPSSSPSSPVIGGSGHYFTTQNLSARLGGDPSAAISTMAYVDPNSGSVALSQDSSQGNVAGLEANASPAGIQILPGLNPGQGIPGVDPTVPWSPPDFASSNASAGAWVFVPSITAAAQTGGGTGSICGCAANTTGKGTYCRGCDQQTCGPATPGGSNICGAPLSCWQASGHTAQYCNLTP